MLEESCGLAVDVFRFWDMFHMSSHSGSQAKEAVLLWNVPVLSAEGKSERLTQNHTILFEALAWKDGLSAHIPLLSVSHMAKPSMTMAGTYTLHAMGRESYLP